MIWWRHCSDSDIHSIIALVVQRIGHQLAELAIEVRFLSRAQIKTRDGILKRSSHRSTDRTPPSEGGNAGSIPAESTKNNKRPDRGVLICEVYALARFRAAAIRAFLRSAVLLLITPRFVALSIAA